MAATAPRDLSDKALGLAPLKPPGLGTNVGPLRVDVLALLSDEAKALVLGELLDMRANAAKGTDGKRPVLIDADMAIRRVARGLYRYELRRADSLAQLDFDVTTGRVPL